MGHVSRNERHLTRGKRERRTIHGEIDRAAEHHRDLLLRMLMDGKDRAWLVDVAYESLVRAVHRLSSDTPIGMLDRNRTPVDGGWSRFRRRVQKTNQPQKSANASRKKKTLATPPPKMR